MQRGQETWSAAWGQGRVAGLLVGKGEVSSVITLMLCAAGDGQASGEHSSPSSSGSRAESCRVDVPEPLPQKVSSDS